ncbi:MAG: hypothetical protein JW891_18305 [Candidatus Lokiarchaeota archaeon]|nr:hypothetical protein [Candidatus Lokiarchaeota archaeon]
MKQVKGSMFKEVVKVIKANKTGAYDNLSDETKKFLQQRILSSAWYPLAAYKEGLNAIVNVVARGKKEIVVKWGKQFCDGMMKSLYKQIVAEGNVKLAMERYKRFHNMIFNFSQMDYNFVSDNEIVITYTDSEPDFENYYYLIKGWNERFFEICTDKKTVGSSFLEKSWEGKKNTKIKINF